jgi:hypothetical protein
LKAERQKNGSLPVGEESEVADADEAWGQQMEQEPAQELVDGQSHEPLLVAMSRVSPSEGYVAIGESNESGVGDGDAMGIGAEITQHMFRAAEGPLGVDDPVVAEQHSQPSSEGPRLGERHEVTVELEFTSMKRVAESGDELAAEDTAEYADGQEEGAPGGDPACMIRSEAPGGNDTMDMRMNTPAPTVP